MKLLTPKEIEQLIDRGVDVIFGGVDPIDAFERCSKGGPKTLVAYYTQDYEVGPHGRVNATADAVAYGVFIDGQYMGSCSVRTGSFENGSGERLFANALRRRALKCAKRALGV